MPYRYDLVGWAAIAEYLGVCERTLRRWWKYEKLPVLCVGPYRPARARSRELDNWCNRRSRAGLHPLTDKRAIRLMHENAWRMKEQEREAHRARMRKLREIRGAEKRAAREAEERQRELERQNRQMPF